MSPTDEAKNKASNLTRRRIGRTARPQQPAQSREHSVQVSNPVNTPTAAEPSQEDNRARSAAEVMSDLEEYQRALEKYNEEQEENKQEGVDSEEPADEYDLWDTDLLNNKIRKKKIEARCEKLSLSKYLLNGGVKQRVPIIPGELEITFRTIGVDEDLEVKRMMFGMKGTDVYINNRFSLMQLTLSLFAINDEVLPSHLDKNQKFDEKLFNKKFDRIEKLPTQLVEDLINNYMWFDERVKKLFNEDLGNS